MKERCGGLAVLVLLLAAFGVGNAQIAFYGVVDPNTHNVLVNSAVIFVTPAVDTVLTPDWGGTSMDTFHFPDIARWPDSVELIGTVNAMPNISMFPSPVPYVWYRFTYGSPIAPMALFYSEASNVEEPKSAPGQLQRLDVSPSVVTSRMVVRVQPLGSDRPVVEVYDAAGNVVRSLNCTAGTNGLAEATWNREDGLGHLVPEGVYFCRYATSEAVAVRKVLVAH